MEEKQPILFEFWDAVRLGFGFGFGLFLSGGLFAIAIGIIFGITLAISS